VLAPHAKKLLGEFVETYRTDYRVSLSEIAKTRFGTATAAERRELLKRAVGWKKRKSLSPEKALLICDLICAHAQKTGKFSPQGSDAEVDLETLVIAMLRGALRRPRSHLVDLMDPEIEFIAESESMDGNSVDFFETVEERARYLRSEIARKRIAN
jgi:hypothetical protein